MKFKISLIIILACCVLSTQAQINFTVAFDGGYALADQNNQMLRNFNNVNSENITDEFGSLRFMSGLELGFRYNFDNSAFSVGYSTLRRGREATQVIEDDVIDTNLNYTMGTFFIGLETGGDKFRIGSTIGSRNLKMKASIGASDDLETIIEDRNLVSKFYFTIVARGNDVSRIALRPYFDLAWGSTNLLPGYNRLLNQNINVSDNFNVIGLSVIFYNGPQNGF